MIYSIRLKIAHNYNTPAANSQHLIRVLPRTLQNRQTLKMHLLEISPEPEFTTKGIDFFENETTSCAHRERHMEMSISLSCHVEMLAPNPWLDASPEISELISSYEKLNHLGPTSPLHFLGPTKRLMPDKSISEFAHDIFDPKESVAFNVQKIGKALHETMTFDPTVTTVDTDPAKAFQLRRGVCQDYTHIMILGLQALQIPTGYVSGYLRTLPPPGGVKLEGADAMHAWVRAWCGPDQGWIEYDPTNSTLVGTDHIVAGFGRDYNDVSPLRGHLRSSGGQTNSQGVDVTVLE